MKNDKIKEVYKNYFLNEVSNTKEWTEIKIIAIKRLKAQRVKYKEMIDIFGLSYKNVLKLANREQNKTISLIFDSLIENKIYPIKENNKVSWQILENY